MYQHIVFVSLHNFPSDINTIDENGNGLFYPLYVAPRSPWNNGPVEGFNSVFSKKFWNKLQFNDEQEIDVKIKDFNVAYEKYSRLVSNNPALKEKDIKYIDDFKDVNRENKYSEHFKADKIYFSFPTTVM